MVRWLKFLRRRSAVVALYTAVWFCTGDTFAAAQCLSGKIVRLYLNSKLVFEYNVTQRRGAELASNGPVFRDHQHRLLPSDSLAIGCCVDANTTDDYGKWSNTSYRMFLSLDKSVSIIFMQKMESSVCPLRRNWLIARDRHHHRHHHHSFICSELFNTQYNAHDRQGRTIVHVSKIRKTGPPT